MTDPKVIARDAAAEAYDFIETKLLNEPNAYKRAVFRAGWDAAQRALTPAAPQETAGEAVALRPMKDAPKDGSSILVSASGPSDGWAVVFWDETWGVDGWWLLDDGKCSVELPLRGSEPDGWLLLPEPAHPTPAVAPTNNTALVEARDIALSAIQAMEGAGPFTESGKDDDWRFRARLARKEALDAAQAHIQLAFDAALSTRPAEATSREGVE